MHEMLCSRFVLKRFFMFCVAGIAFQAGLQAQHLKRTELGFLTGVSSLGIESPVAQPVYGLALSLGWSNYLHAEAAVYYSQRMRGTSVQSDYAGMMLMFKPGYRTKRAGIFYAGGLAINPALYHRNTENHTYLSTLNGLGAEFYLLNRLTADIKFCMDIGLTGALYENNQYKTYTGPVLLLGIRFNLSCGGQNQ